MSEHTETEYGTTSCPVEGVRAEIEATLAPRVVCGDGGEGSGE